MDWSSRLKTLTQYGEAGGRYHHRFTGSLNLIRLFSHKCNGKSCMVQSIKTLTHDSRDWVMAFHSANASKA